MKFKVSAILLRMEFSWRCLQRKDVSLLIEKNALKGKDCFDFADLDKWSEIIKFRGFFFRFLFGLPKWVRHDKMKWAI